ncbi:MAG: helix-turn-helix domain-containing protein [Egibacteraceae bacterium]
MAVRTVRRLLGRSEATYLNALGVAARTAPTKIERQRAREDAVRAAQRRRVDGVSWPVLAQAIGVSPRTLRRWRRESGDVKPPAPALVLTLGSAQCSLRYETQAVSRQGLQSIYKHSSQNESINASIMSVRVEMMGHSPDAADRLQLILPAEPSRPERGALFLAGHAQGGFRFDEEAAVARHLAWPAFVPFDYAPFVELVEITQLIEEHVPRLLHVSAHAAFDGPWLSDQSEPLAVSWPAVRDAITRAGVRPTLAVFNVCDSTDAALLLEEGVSFTITCSGTVGDDAARLFTRSLSSRLIRRSVRSSFKDACATLLSHYPETDHMYELHARSGTDTMLFS